MGRQDLEAYQAYQDHTDHTDPTDLKDLKDREAHKDPEGHKDPQDHPDNTDHQEGQEGRTDLLTTLSGEDLPLRKKLKRPISLSSTDLRRPS